ncbi:unnamed protein product [Rhizophagus irregularis]|uniref:Uncharacterized protein n=1 Tax=Rhizophagus irregularis TaxID=588596 RepID=A0A915YYU4_9GLOM|nr:unnamed protein product [Rhizophagus irregularis]CAB5193115.1 unnamed protein product [Rhizophagus irregularis]CAB5352208.1 unnamed protein product [Rhizophagus irregularis]
MEKWLRNEGFEFLHVAKRLRKSIRFIHHYMKENLSIKSKNKSLKSPLLNQNQVNNKENNEIEIHHALIEEKEAITKKLVIYGSKLLGTLRNVSLNYGEGKRITEINDKYSNIEDGHVIYLFLVSLL